MKYKYAITSYEIIPEVVPLVISFEWYNNYKKDMVYIGRHVSVVTIVQKNWVAINFGRKSAISVISFRNEKSKPTLSILNSEFCCYFS